MSGIRPVQVLVALVFASCVLAEDWVTNKDREALSNAEKNVGELCGDVSSDDVDQESGRKALDRQMGGNNIILEVLTEAKDKEDIGTKLEEKITVQFVLQASGSLVLAILLGFVWFGCCWSACSCCRCCRCGAKDRQTPFVAKICFLVFAALLFGTVVFAGLYANMGSQAAIAGFENMACSSAKMINGTLGGQQDPYFIGMMPLLQVFADLEQKLDSSSQMMTDVRNLVSETQVVSDSVTIATETVALLGDIMGNMPSDIATNKHSCQFCTEVSPTLVTTATELRNSVGAALDQVRKEVDNQLSPANSQVLQDALTDASKPLVEVKELVRDTFEIFMDTDSIDKLLPLVQLGILSLSIVGLLLFCCMGFSVGLFAFAEKSGDSYRKSVPRCACCTWCCGFFYAMLAFFLAGLLNAVGVPLASTCLIMDDFSSSVLDDISPALELDLTGVSGTMIKNIIDKCIVAPPSENNRLLDIITVGTPPETLQEKIIDSTKDQIDNKLAALTSTSPSVTLRNNAAIDRLINMVSDPIDMMILPTDLSTFQNDPDYQDMFTKDPRSDTSQNLAGAFVSSVRCSTGTVGPDTPVLGNETILGVDTFVQRLSGLAGVLNTRSDCADKVNCASLSAGNSKDACEAGNRYVELKQNIRDITTFRCDVFEGSNSAADCDPYNMVKSGSTWSGGCLKGDGTMVRKTKTCNLAQFVSYVQNYNQRLDLVMRRIDDAAAASFTKIDTGMRTILDRDIIQPLDHVANGVTCGFIGAFYREVVAGMCFQGVVGFGMITNSYIICGALTLGMIVLVYGIWRRTIDNVNAEQDANKASASPDNFS